MYTQTALYFENLLVFGWACHLYVTKIHSLFGTRACSEQL